MQRLDPKPKFFKSFPQLLINGSIEITGRRRRLRSVIRIGCGTNRAEEIGNTAETNHMSPRLIKFVVC